MGINMSKHPEVTLTSDDIPAARKGAISYAVRSRVTGGHEVISVLPDGSTGVVEFKPSEQAAIRLAIRLQKKANANA